MKRSRESMKSPRPRRQEPVSCQFCRTKKLRCSRESPCSNCVARKIECVPASTTPQYTTKPASNELQEASVGSENISLQSLHERILTIERALSSNSNRTPNDGGATPKPPQTLPIADTAVGAKSKPSDAGIPDDQSEIENDEVTAHFARCGFQSAIDTTQFLQIWPASGSTHLTSSQWHEVFPTYERAVRMLDRYANNICWTYHFIHLPTLRRQLEETYQCFERHDAPEPPVLALLCIVFALAKYFSPSASIPESTMMPEEQGYGDFVTLASRALSQARHLDNPTVESIQAVLLLASSLLLNMGAMTAFRVLLTAMYISAQTLLIHQLDSPKNQRLRQTTPYCHIELEIKRRLWWHIASSDWIFAFMSGTQTSSYIVHSRLMHVNLPSNADDASITRTHSPDEPLAIPTEMTYFLLRCRLSMIFRAFMDHAAEKGLAMHEVPYDDILAFDRNIADFNKDVVPWFMKSNMSTEFRQRSAELDKQRPYLVWQRIMAQFSATTQMSGLHRPYIIRGAREPRYAYSRMVCLRSARTVLECEKMMRVEMIRPSTPSSSSSPLSSESMMMMPDPSKIWAMMYQVFLATVVLVMDYNFNKDEPRAEERVAEIMDCCRRLKAARSVSAVAARGLEELKQVVRKWGLLTSISNVEFKSTQEDVTMKQAADHDSMNVGNLFDEEVFPPTISSGENEFASMDWTESWDFDVELDEPQWNALFQDLESRSCIF